MIEWMVLCIGHEMPLLLHAGFLKGAPLLWASLGGAYSERSGVINIGLEGMMLVGAFAAVAVSGMIENPWLGLMAGAFAGGLFGLLHAFVCLTCRANQIVSGMGINLIALGLTGFLLSLIFHTRGNSPEVMKLPAIQGGSIHIPFLSPLLFPLSPLHILLIMVLVATLYVFYRTRFGLRMRACGEDPTVVKSLGASVMFYRYSAVCISGVLAGIGGVQLSMSDISQFSVGMTNGRGFIALAALICSGWRPGWAFVICFLFGGIEALGERLQGALPWMPSRLSLALPFILALIVLAFRRASLRPPHALGKLSDS